jgi:hypothetical protein
MAGWSRGKEVNNRRPTKVVVRCLAAELAACHWATQPTSSHMKQYKIFRHPSGTTEAVKQGWSWPASLFSFFWAPFKRLWVLFVGGLLATVALGYLAAAVTNASQAASLMNLVLTVVSVVFGVKGNAWREANLVRRGYELVGCLIAEDGAGAVASCLKASSPSAAR